MAAIFLVAGLGIKRELLVGELSSTCQALLPIASAYGGMLVPAGSYLALTGGRVGVPSRGIPMATDIALPLGVVHPIFRT